MSYAALAVAAVGTGYKIYDSAQKKKQAKRIEKNTVRPVYNKPGEVNDVYDLAASEVNDTWMQDYVTQRTSQSEANGIDAILKSGGKADFATIHNTFGSQLGQMLQQLKVNRANNIAAFNNAAYAKGRASDTEFQYNQDAPYKDAMQLKALLLTQSEQSKADAVNMAATGVANYGVATLSPGSNTKVVDEEKSLGEGVKSVDKITSMAGTPNNGQIIPRKNGMAAESGQPGNSIFGVEGEWLEIPGTPGMYQNTKTGQLMQL